MMSPKGHETDLIGREELKEKLERGDDFKLVMVLGEWEYRAKRISGSLRVSTPEEGLEALDPDEEVVLYDSGPACFASRMACRFLKARGYARVRRYDGGLEDWEGAGYALEGESVG
jgi:rhodanese-related sulfurtransferase